MTAVPNLGYYFVSWSDGVLTASRTDTNVTANISVAANFAAYPPLLTTADPPGENYYSPQTVYVTLTQTIGQPGATIYYTLDGSDPTINSPNYSTPISISAPTTLKFAAFDGTTWETVRIEYYAWPLLQTTAIPAGGSYNTAQTVTLARVSGQPDAAIYYTTNDSDPIASGTNLRLLLPFQPRPPLNSLPLTEQPGKRR